MRPTIDEIRAQVSYDPETGQFRRLVDRPRSPAGSIADNKLDTHGYRVVRVCNHEYRAHRLAWVIVHGEWPSKDVDHANCNRADNGLSNLRLATRSQNLGNSRRKSTNTSGHKGVHLYAATGRWQAYVNVDGKRKHLGYFGTSDEAAAAYMKAAQLSFGEFANRG